MNWTDELHPETEIFLHPHIVGHDEELEKDEGVKRRMSGKQSAIHCAVDLVLNPANEKMRIEINS